MAANGTPQSYLYSQRPTTAKNYQDPSMAQDNTNSGNPYGYAPDGNRYIPPTYDPLSGRWNAAPGGGGTQGLTYALPTAYTPNMGGLPNGPSQPQIDLYGRRRSPSPFIPYMGGAQNSSQGQALAQGGKIAGGPMGAPAPNLGANDTYMHAPPFAHNSGSSVDKFSNPNPQTGYVNPAWSHGFNPQPPASNDPQGLAGWNQGVANAGSGQQALNNYQTALSGLVPTQATGIAQPGNQQPGGITQFQDPRFSRPDMDYSSVNYQNSFPRMPLPRFA